MTDVAGTLPQGASVDIDTFADLTTVPVSGVGWDEDGQVVVTFDGTLDQATADAVQRRIVSRNSTEETIRQQAVGALKTNRDFLALASPTNAQAVAQIQALTRQNNKLIRLALGLLDGTD